MFAHNSYDALVVGARCAGAATAMLLARKGWRVLVIDRGSYGTDTISTHALMRGGVLQLHRWGVLPRLQEAGTPPVRETTFRYGDEAVTVPIVSVAWRGRALRTTPHLAGQRPHLRRRRGRCSRAVSATRSWP